MLSSTATDRRRIGARRGNHVSRADVEAEITEMLGTVPTFMQSVPDHLIESEWASFKNL